MTLDATVAALIQRLKANELVALGSHGSWPANAPSAQVPRNKGLDACEAIVRAAFKSKRLAIAVLTGTLVRGRDHSQLLTTIAANLPGSRVVCLNLGEFSDADDAAYAALEAALPRTFVGNLYIKDPVNAAERARKRRIKDILNANKRKAGYRQQIARDDAWRLLKHGCNAWFNPKAATRDAAVQWAQERKPEHCKRGCSSDNIARPGPGQRCRGISGTGRRCCLCTRHPSLYCHHHRFA